MINGKKTNLDEDLREAVKLLVERCPSLAETTYWAETSAIALEELGHRQSSGLDFHTRKTLMDVRSLLARLLAILGDDFKRIESPDEFGAGFRATISLPNGSRVTIETLANDQDVSDSELVPSTTVPSLMRVSLRKYLTDKIQCVVERVEARNLVDIGAGNPQTPHRRGIAGNPSETRRGPQIHHRGAARRSLADSAGVRPAVAEGAFGRGAIAPGPARRHRVYVGRAVRGHAAQLA